MHNTHTERDISLSLSLSLSILTPVLGNVTWLFGNLHVTQMGQNYGKLENSHKNKRFKAGISSVWPQLLLLHLVILLLLLFILLPHAKQTPSEHLGKTFEIQTALKYFSPFVLFNLPNKSDDDDDEENFLPLRHDKTSPRKDEPEKEAEQDRRTGQTGGQSAQQTDRQSGKCLENLLQLLPRFGVSKTYSGLILPFSFRPCEWQLLSWRPLPRRCCCSWHNKPNLLIMGK